MKSLEKDVISLFGKFKRDDYPYFINTWGVLKISDFADSPKALTNLHKKEFTQKAAMLFKKKRLNLKDLHNLDLIYVQKYSRTKQWTVYKLDKIQGTEWQTQDPHTFQQSLEKQLQLFYKAEVCLKVQKQVNWLRISLEDCRRGNKTVSPSVAYIVHHPRTEFLMVTGLKMMHMACVMQCVMTVLECHDVEQLQLKGYHLDSLMQLAINKYSQGSFSEYRLCQVDENPLQAKTRKRKRTVQLSDDEDSDSLVVSENKAEKRKRLELVQETFGSNALPILEKVEYKMETKFRGGAYAPGMNTNEIFQCSLKFEGHSVIEGIKNLARAGLAEMPMKDHMGKLHSMAMNKISLRMKQNPNKSTRKSTSTSQQDE